jgi:hypothetical protein
VLGERSVAKCAARRALLTWQLAVGGCRLDERHHSPHQGVVERLAKGSVLRLAE